jgi:outer membrane protein assembly factor BamB
MARASRNVLLAAAVALGLASALPADDWSRFRGPNGAGVASDWTLPDAWTGEHRAWSADLPGVGHGSPVAWGGRVFVVSGDEESGQRILGAFDLESGQVLWQREYLAAASGKHQLNSFASATPAVDEERLYVTWGTADEHVVLALAQDGSEAWRRDLGPYEAGHGFGASLIRYRDLLIVPREHQGASAIVALEAATGEERWRAERPSEVVYATPCLFEGPRGAELILVSYERGIASLDPQTGRANWQLDVFDRGHVEATVGSPIVAGDLVLGMCGWLGVRQEVIAVRPDGGTAERVWTFDRGAPLCTTPLAVGELVFCWSDEGIVTCLEAATGRRLWQNRVGGTYYGSPICVGDALVALSADGEAVVLAADRKFRELARHDLGEASHSTPAVAGGKLLVRTFARLLAVELGSADAGQSHE